MHSNRSYFSYRVLFLWARPVRTTKVTYTHHTHPSCSCSMAININSFMRVCMVCMAGVIVLAGRVYFFMFPHKQMHYNKMWLLSECRAVAVARWRSYGHTWTEFSAECCASVKYGNLACPLSLSLCLSISPSLLLSYSPLSHRPSHSGFKCACVTANKNGSNSVTSLVNCVWRHTNIFYTSNLLSNVKWGMFFCFFFLLSVLKHVHEPNAIMYNSGERKKKRIFFEWSRVECIHYVHFWYVRESRCDGIGARGAEWQETRGVAAHHKSHLCAKWGEITFV